MLDDQFASRHHAEIRYVDYNYRVQDLNSKNGVYVGGQRIASGATAPLEDGIEVKFAHATFRFHDPSATITAPALIAVREPELRIDLTTRQVYVDGRLLDPPLSVKQFDLLWFLYQSRGPCRQQRRNCHGRLAGSQRRRLRCQHRPHGQPRAQPH